MIPTTPPPTANIAGFIWNDTNNDAIIDSTETFFGTVSVILKSGDCSGSTVSSATSNGGGTYAFPRIPPGDYCVEVNQGTLPTPTYGWLCTTHNKSQALITLKAGTALKLDFGFLDTVW
jgi:hypothetical protein